MLTIDSTIFSRGVADIVTREELQKLLQSGKRLRIKHGIDATSPDLHVGHAVSLWKMRALQEEGHSAIILFGDVTTRIGDPTGKSKTRPALSPAAVRKNIRSLKKQVEKILSTDKKLYQAHVSSEWYRTMRFEQFLKLLSMVTHARLIERDMFRARMKEGSEIFMHELSYPILQGYDSVMLKSDLTIIGSDQLFNEHMGRFFQEKFGQSPQVIMSMKILPGLDGGEKMSKSLGNFIGISDTPQDKFGKVMKLKDSLIVPYFEVYTDVPEDEIAAVKKKLDEGGNPKDAKLSLAEAIVARYHGIEIAKKEHRRFINLFSKKEMSDIPYAEISEGTYNALEILIRLKSASSRSEARRLIMQRACAVDGSIIDNPNGFIPLKSGMVVRVGKKSFFRIR